MSKTTRIWVHKFFAAIISGGASSVVSGFITMGFAPDKFNITSLQGLGHLFSLLVANFVVSGFIGMMFYLKQSPLPPEEGEEQ
jgi:hypothetical protein